MPEAALNGLYSKASTEFGRRRRSAIEDSSRELPVELRAVVLAVKTTDASPTFVGAEWVVYAVPAALRRIVEPDLQLMFEECRKPADFGLGVSISVQDSCKRAGYQVFANTVLTEATPFNMPKQYVAHRMDYRVQAKIWSRRPPYMVERADSKAYIECGNPGSIRLVSSSVLS
jgi:hypothetical protein